MKRKLTVLLCSVTAACMLGAAVACADNSEKSGYTFEDYTYENPSDELQTDEFVLDGKFDESFWSEKRWHSTDDVWNTDAGQKLEGVSTRMSAYLGDEGVLFGVEVFDTSFTYYSYGRSFYANSGVEVFLSAEGKDLTEVAGGGWELLVDASGNHASWKYLSGPGGNIAYGNSFSPFPMTMYSAAHVNGEINGDATSMSVELYVPYASLGLTEKPEKLYADYAYNRNRDSNAVRDAFCRIGMHEKNAAWANAASWYQITDEGLSAYDINVSVTKGEGEFISRGFAMSDCDEPVTVTPAEGYYLESLKVNGRELQGSDLSYNADGSVVYTVRGATEDVDMEAAFAQYPSQTMSGTLTVSGTDAPVTLYAENGISRTTIATLTDETPYSYTLPAIGTRIVATAEGCLDAAVTLTEAGGDETITMKALPFGNNTNVAAGYRGDPSQWELTSFETDKVVRSLTTGNGMYVVYDDIFSETVFLSADIVLPRGVSDTRVGFSFVGANGERGFLALLYSWQSGKYSVQGIGKDSAGESYRPANIPEEYADKLASEGINFSVLYQNGTFTIWLDGELFTGDCAPAKGDYSGMLFADGGKVAAALETWGYRGEYQNITISDSFTPTTTVTLPESTENGKVEATATYGKAFTITLTPESGYSVESLTINGKDLYSYSGYEISVQENVVTVTFAEWTNFNADIDAVFAVADVTDVALGIVVTDPFGVDKAPAAEGTEVTLTGLRGTETVTLTATVDNTGTADFGEVPNGRYILSAEGYESVEIVVGEELASEYELLAAFIDEDDRASAVDTSRRDEGIISSTGNFQNQDIVRGVAANEDFVISAVISSFRAKGKDLRVGFYAYLGAGDNPGDSGNANHVRGGFKINDKGLYYLEVMNGYWQRVELSKEQSEAFEKGELRIGFGRSGGVFFLAAGVGDGPMEQLLVLETLTNDMTTSGDLTIGIFNNADEAVTFSGVCFETGKTLTTVKTTMDLTLNVTLAANAFDGTAETSANGEKVTLTRGEKTYETTVNSDGEAVFEGVKYGEYTLTMEDMDQSYSLKIVANSALEDEYAFWEAFLGDVNTENLGYFTEDVEAGSLSTAADKGNPNDYQVAEDQLIDRTIAAGDFMISATLAYTPGNTNNDTRLGWFVTNGTAKLYGYLTLEKSGSYKVQFVYKESASSNDVWGASYTLSEELSAAYEADKLRFGLGRAGEFFVIAVGIDEGAGAATKMQVKIHIDAANALEKVAVTPGVVSKAWAQVHFNNVRISTDFKALVFQSEWKPTAIDYTVEAKTDFLIGGTASELLSGSGGEKRLAFAAWEQGKDAPGSWSDNGSPAGVVGGLKLAADGTISLGWTNGGWTGKALTDAQKTAYANGTLWFGFGRIDGKFFLCAGTSADDAEMTFCPINISGTLTTCALQLGKYAPSSQGALSDVQLYTGDEVPVTLPQQS